MKTRRSWREKMQNPNLPKIVPVFPRMRARYGNSGMLVPSPHEVEALMRQVPEGRLITPSRIRALLARQHAVPVTCPLTTGIFLRIAAEAAEEDRARGRTPVTPYWRVVHEDGSLFENFPGGARRQHDRLAEEGHRFLSTGPAGRVALDRDRLWGDWPPAASPRV